MHKLSLSRKFSYNGALRKYNSPETSSEISVAYVSSCLISLLQRRRCREATDEEIAVCTA